ncbi:MAG: RNA-guided endonuclease InsQ/TnpB family protein, partial [Candidatus Poribacteria bacterium]
DEPNKGYKLLHQQKLQISLGVDKEQCRLRVIGKIKEPLCLRETDEIKNFRLCKEYDRFYAVFCIERAPAKNNARLRLSVKQKDLKNWIAIDPNHKNFFVAIDNEGNSFEFAKIPQLKYWDSVIDRIKSKRDLCSRKSIKVTENEGKDYWLPSERWERLNRALQTAYRVRRDQLKQVRFTVSNWIAKNYDYVAIGDYTPSLDTAVFDTMHRSMLNQEMIGSFRKDLKWTMNRSGKQYTKVCEKDTTKTCCICGLKEEKEPSVRFFICPNCHSLLARDINSAVNIAKKENLLSGSDYEGWDLSSPSYTVQWDFSKCELLFAGDGEKKFSSSLN